MERQVSHPPAPAPARNSTHFAVKRLGAIVIRAGESAGVALRVPSATLAKVLPFVRGSRWGRERAHRGPFLSRLNHSPQDEADHETRHRRDGR